MGSATNPSPLERLISDLMADFGQPVVIWQFAVLALALAVGWTLSVRFAAEVGARETTVADGWAIHRAKRAVSRLVMPLSVLCVVLLGRWALARYYPTRLLDLAVPLAVSFAAVRMLVYVLRRAFHNSVALQTFERLLAVLIWSGVALHITGALPDVRAWLDSIELPLGKTKLSILDAGAGLGSLGVTLLAALWLGSMLESWLDKAAHLDTSLRAVLARIGKAVLIVVAVLLGLSLVGFDLTLLSVFGGALGVGLGLGLQKIASNYVSGFIILLDKSLRIGDVVSVDKYSGVVTQIRTRYTVLRSLDGSEAILPNELLVSQAVSNLSYSDKRNWLSTQLAVAHQSDVELAMRLMVEAASAHSRVLTEPAPSAYLSEFGADGLVLMLGFWIRDPEHGRINLISDINLAIWRAFAEHKIQVPSPQRDVRMTLVRDSGEGQSIREIVDQRPINSIGQ
jgi:small-conductance mechanosensitive channel